MNSKKRIIFSILLLIFIFLILTFFSLKNLEQEKQDHPVLKKISLLIPLNIKAYVKATVLELRINLSMRDKIHFLKTEDEKNYIFPEANYSLKKFAFSPLKFTGPRAYLSYNNKNLFLVTGTGRLFYATLDNLKKENIIFKRINTNLEKIVGSDYIKKYIRSQTVTGYGVPIISNILVKNNKIYLAYQYRKKDNCYGNAILVSELNLEKVDFQTFFETKKCQPKFNKWVGGTLSTYKENKILFSTGSFNCYVRDFQNNDNCSQSMDFLYGKILSIDENTKEYEIISKGHRNPQGLYYDAQDNIIFNSEHGPQGGCEINLNVTPDNIVKNYGWPISSYGEHPGYPNKDNSERYKRAPLYKSHSKHGFEEPLIYFNPSIAPTAIVQTPKINNIKNIFVGTLSGRSKEKNMSVLNIVLDEENKVLNTNILKMNERVRDIVYVTELNKLFIYLETSGSIAVLDIENK